MDLNPKYRPTVVADARRLPFRDSAFDEVYLSHILEHVIDPENILEEVHRVLEVGKNVKIVFPNFASSSVLMAWCVGFHGKNSTRGQRAPCIIPYELRYAYNIVYGSHTIGEYDVHHVPLTLSILRALLRESGFNLVSIEGDTVFLPLRRSRTTGIASKALARIFPGKANIITIVAQKH